MSGIITRVGVLVLEILPDLIPVFVLILCGYLILKYEDEFIRAVSPVLQLINKGLVIVWTYWFISTPLIGGIIGIVWEGKTMPAFVGGVSIFFVLGGLMRYWVPIVEFVRRQSAHLF